MLARNATHRTTSFIFLDFLAPRLLCKRHYTQRKLVDPIKVGLTDASRDISPWPPTSTLASPVDPTRILSQLDRQLGQFDEHELQGLTNTQVVIFNKATIELRTAAKTADLEKAWAIWNALRKRELHRFFGPAHHDMYSRIIVSYCSARKPDSPPFSKMEKTALGEISTATAAAGATEGLKTFMLCCIKLKEPDTVILLFDRYKELLGEKALWKGTEDSEEADEEDERSSQERTARDPVYASVRGDILLAAITAYAMKDSFPDALHAALQSSRFSHTSLHEFLKLIRYDSSLRRKVQDYARRLDVATLVARPALFARKVSVMTHDGTLHSLEKLYTSVIAGLSEDTPFLTVNASNAGNKGPVFVPDHYWVSFLTGFMRWRRTDLGEKLWDDAIRLGVRPTVGLWTALIDGYGGLKAVDEAMNTWDVMLAQGVKPDVMTYRALIYALYYAGHPDEAFVRFLSFKTDLAKMTPPPEESSVLVVYNTVLHGLLFHSREADAQALLAEMQTKGPKPDIVSFNTFLRFYGRKGQMKTMAAYLQMLEPAGLVGDVFTFSTILSALLKVRDDAPQIMLNLMERQGVKPNAATLTVIIDHQMKARTEGSFRTAMQLLEKMERSEDANARPNEVTYTSILSGIHRRNWLPSNVAREYTQLIWEKIKAGGITPKRVTYHIVIKACLENPEPDGIQEAMRYYKEMVDQGIFIANDTWYIMLHGLLSRKEWELANELVEDMWKSKFVPAGALSDLVHRVRRHAIPKTKAGPASYF